jgi:endonuclease YncB( thermonuclease family)
MTNVFVLIFLTSVLGLLVGLFSPSTISKIFRRPFSRKQATAIFGGLAIFAFVMIGIFAPPVTPEQKAILADAPLKPSMPLAEVEPVTPSDATPQNTDAELQASNPEVVTVSDSAFLVTHVVDGDTFDVDLNGQKERIRMIGIDTPETVDPRKSVQCFGKEASDKMKALIADQKIVLEADASQDERDKYGRLLRYAFLPDGTNVGLYLIQEGYAREYTYNSAYKYQQEFKSAENSARSAKKGLWADNACTATENPSNLQSTPLAPQPTPTVTPEAPSIASPPSSVVSGGPAVKKSKSSICHAKGTQYYDQTKNYTAYETLQACLDSGGRMPR